MFSGKNKDRNTLNHDALRGFEFLQTGLNLWAAKVVEEPIVDITRLDVQQGKYRASHGAFDCIILSGTFTLADKKSKKGKKVLKSLRFHLRMPWAVTALKHRTRFVWPYTEKKYSSMEHFGITDTDTNLAAAISRFGPEVEGGILHTGNVLAFAIQDYLRSKPPAEASV